MLVTVAYFSIKLVLVVLLLCWPLAPKMRRVLLVLFSSAVHRGVQPTSRFAKS